VSTTHKIGLFNALRPTVFFCPLVSRGSRACFWNLFFYVESDFASPNWETTTLVGSIKLIFFAVVVHLGNAFVPGGHKGAVSRVLPRSNIASGDPLLQDLLAAYKAQIKQLEESKEEVVNLWKESKQEVVDLWKDKEKQWGEKETRLEGDLLRAKAEAHAVVDMRVLVEIAARHRRLESPLRLFVCVCVCVFLGG
jgi:hypothetical protein